MEDQDPSPANSMRDGVELLARRYYPARGGSQPTILVRSCYGTTGPFGLIGTLFAERGFQVRPK
jgi:uncharacterized protein